MSLTSFSSRFKSELCRNWEEKRTCRYGLKCQFAHGDDELRRIPRHPKVKRICFASVVVC